MKFIPLASSSSGNAYMLESGESRILLECGTPWRKLQRLTGFTLSSLDACIISHEHKDHARCWKNLIESGVPVYASPGTARALGAESIQPLKPLEPVDVGGFQILPFPTIHDAAQPVGFLIRSRPPDGDKLVFATDTSCLNFIFPAITMAAVECNYEERILSRSRYPDKVRSRIRNAHMSISRACSWLEKLDKSCLREVWLLHLSDACSDEREFQRQAQAAAGPGVSVAVCQKEVK